MRLPIRRLGLLAVTGALSFGTAQAVMTSAAFAYGKADQPLAQIEVSANCDNPSFPLCAPAPNGVGLGGIWFWVEIDANGTGDLSGAACAHGPGGSGAGSIKTTAEWTYSTAEAAPPGSINFGAIDPNDNYYLVNINDGGPPWLIPVSTGHYGTHLAPGVQIQITVAP
jgi:hypothetical protein